MKKILPKILFTLLTVAVFALTAFACTQTEKPDDVTVKSISLLQTHEGPYFKGDPNIDFGDVVMLVVYSNKQTETVTLNDSMISGADRLKFGETGVHTVVINYNGATCFYGFEVVDVAQEGKFLAAFYSRGGTAIKTVAVSGVSAFSVPEREGYIFDGWYPDAVFADNGAVVSWGERAVEPYALTANTAFYAKWVDVRICKVNFYDYDETVIYSEQIHYGEKIDVNSFAYPEELVTEGKTFLGWSVTNGNADEVTVDLIVRASFFVEKCTVKIEYANAAGEPVTSEKTVDYGTLFAVGPGTVYTKREKDGHTSRFVVYLNHAEDSMDGEYEELGENQSIVLTAPYTTIKTEFTILTYKIIIWNGKTKQTKNALKLGKIEGFEYERTYENAVATRDFSVDWNTDFDFSQHTQEPNISSPASFEDENGTVGYYGQWCFSVLMEGGIEVLYNSEGRIWNEEKQIFEERPDKPAGETDREWILTDKDGEYVAFVRNGIPTGIRGNITVRALYTKKSYSVRLIKIDGGSQNTLVTFNAKYLTDFTPYSGESYPHAPTVNGTETNMFPALDITGYVINDAGLLKKTSIGVYNPTVEGNDIEKLYLKENTDLTVKGYAFNGGYYLTSAVSNDNLTEDWEIRWYKNAACTEEIEFNEGVTLSIEADTPIYCKDIDKRQYIVTFSYDYDFVTDAYTTFSGEIYCTEKEAVTAPSVGNIQATVNDVTVVYTFDDWYDIPYGLYLKTGYKGNKVNLQNRKASVYCYAHYRTDKKVKVTIYDKTQSVAYIGINGNTASGFRYEECSVADNTVSYDLPVGTVLDLSMIYKGKIDKNADVIKGQYFYDNAKSNAFYNAYYGTDGILSLYLGNLFGFGKESENLLKTKKVIEAFIDDYRNVLGKVYSHDYGGYSINGATPSAFSEYSYYLNRFDAKNYPSTDSITTLGDEFDKIAEYGDGILSAIGAKVNISEINSVLLALDVNEFIGYYAKLLNTLYAHGYTNEHTGLVGIGFGTVAEPTFEDGNGMVTVSVYEKLLTVIAIIEKYIEFLNAYKDYELKEESPKYETSYYDLNNAYGYNGVKDVKYMFGGWYRNAAYSVAYQSDMAFTPFALSQNETLYAKWTDITRGTEGLVYEEVSIGTNKYAYVLVDFTNRVQFENKGYGEGAGTDEYYYYVTTNDTGAVPEKIESGEIDIQIPSQISKYLNVSDEAALEQAEWNDEVNPAYKRYLIYANGTYIQAPATYNGEQKYYRKVEYDVIGIKAGAFDNYARYISSVTIPLNMYFLEEGAFRNCNVVSFTRTAPKKDENEVDLEITLNYVTVDNERAIYQTDKNSLPYAIGRKSGYGFKVGGEKTLIAYSVEYTGASYSLVDGTLAIGDYAFSGARYLVRVDATSSLKRIGDYAFRNSSAFTTLGDTDGIITVSSSITEIGREAFINCARVSEVVVEGRSGLETVGNKAFEFTEWYGAKRGVISLMFTDKDDRATGIILGAEIGALSTDYDLIHKYDINGSLDDDGEFFSIDSESGKLLMSGENDSRKSVIVTYAVKSISEGAFAGIDAMNYSFESVGRICAHAFENPVSLRKISFTDAYFNQGTDIEAGAFYGLSDRVTVDVVFGSEDVKDTVLSGSGWNIYESSFNLSV